MEEMKEQEQLMAVYKRLGELRRSGVKMKDIASEVDMPPNVLSALYATVLPAFVSSVEQLGFDGALTEALANVNNLSRKRLMDSLEGLYGHLMAFRPGNDSLAGQPSAFLKSLEKLSVASESKIGALEGMYMSYSCSSSLRTLKAEPFYFTSAGEGRGLVIGRKSVHGVVREGIGIIQERQILYLLLNAFQEPDFSLVSVYLQLPFLERIHYLRGLYLVPDYNKNPIARRIVLVKMDERYTPERFREIAARLIPREEFTETEKLLYDYTCEDGDLIKMCTLPSPKLDLRDLKGEKELLSFYGRSEESSEA